MKAVVVGAGRWGMNLVRTLAEMGALEAVVDANEANLNKVKESVPDVHTFGTLEEALGSTSGPVLIATPAQTHYELASKAMEAGRDVFVEKPITLSAKEAEQLVKLADSKGATLMVGHLLLYQPAIGFIHDYIANGKLGRVYSLHQERLNLGKARNVENALWSLGVHDVAVLLYLAGGAPESVAGVGQAALNPAIQDDFYVHMTFSNGVQAHLHTGWLWPERRRRLTVVGEKGMLVFDELAQQVTLHRKTIDENLNNQDEGEEIVFENSDPPLRLELEHFLNCCQTKQVAKSDGKSALQVIEVLERVENNG
ncbi:MAG: Gfo/Idh/MocA family protein [Fimbriimonadaceae bacterium]